MGRINPLSTGEVSLSGGRQTHGTTNAGGGRFPLIPFEELVPDARSVHLVKKLVPRTGLVVIWGPPKCGKSFWVFDLMLHVALGWPYRGRRVHQGAIVYCAMEGAEGFKARAEAFRRRKLHDSTAKVPLFLMATPMTLAANHKELVSSIKAQLGETLPAAVVIDTLNRSLAGSESSDEDMSGYVQAADAIREAFGCVVVVVHHCGINDTRPRGHTSLTGAVDAQISVKREGGTILTTVEYMKEGPEGEVLGSKLEPVNVGVDEDGEAITSCVVQEEETCNPAPRKKGLPKGQEMALRALKTAVTEHGEFPPQLLSDHIPGGVRIVTIERWRDYTYQHGISGSDQPRARQQAFKRSSGGLIEAGLVGTWTDYVWPILSKEAQDQANLAAQGRNRITSPSEQTWRTNEPL